MRRAVFLAAFLAVATAPPRAAAAGKSDAMSEDEKAFCADDLELVEKRRKLFEAQGLSASEIARKNAGALESLAECRDGFAAKQRSGVEEKQDQEEAARRAGPDATPVEREKVWREVRRERLGSKSPSSLTAAEKAELEAGMSEELAATHQALDLAHSRDKSFMRVVYSALACYHGGRREGVVEQISSEESLLKLGTGDKQKLYTLRSELRAADEVLARSREASRSYESGLERCTNPTVAVLSHCLAARAGGERKEPACESEEIQQYIRLVK